MKNSNLVFKLMDVFRSTSMAQDEQLKLSMQLLAWAYLSENQTLSETLRIKNYASSTDEALQKLWESLYSEIGIRDSLFFGFKPFQYYREIQDAIRLILNASSAGLIKELDLTDIVCDFSSSRSCGEIAIPSEVVKYLVALAELEEKTAIYLPWDKSGQFMGRVATKNRSIYVETKSNDPYPFIIRLFHEGEIEISITDPIRVIDGKLRTFDTAISFPPFGIKYDEKDTANDWFNRFPEKTTNGTILWIRHILAQTKGLAVIAVPNTVLFSAGIEKAFRQNLLSNRKVKAVISLPSKLLYNTGISFSVLILSNDKPCENVLFIDAATTGDFKKSNKTRDTLSDSNLDDLIAISTGKRPSKYGIEVPVEDVLKNDSQLQPSHYVKSEKDNQLSAKFSGMPKQLLDDVVTLVRPMNTLSDSDEEQGIVAYEIGAANMPEYGCINTHGREVTISSDAIKKNQHQFLKSGDIVLIIKGSVGKLGIIGEAPPAGEGGWVAGQSSIVLRLNTSSIDARWLLVFLRSEIGQALILKLVSGATISLLKLNDLLKLEIPVSDRETQQQIIADFDQEVELQSQIDEIHKKQTELAKKYWSLA